VEAFFSTPLPFDRSALRTIASAALQQFGEYGLRPSQIWQRAGDQMFDYELSFSLFNNQAKIRYGAERMFVNVQNARSNRDARLLVECVCRAAKCLDGRMFAKVSVQATSHAAFENEANCDAFFAPFVDKANSILGGGRIVVVQEQGWSNSVRLMGEKSLSVQNGAFLVWSTESAGDLDVEVLQGVADKFGRAVEKLGLQVHFE
jgi:hypothetical protein